MGLFVPLDVLWPDDESIIEVGMAGAGAHAFIMCLAKRSETDGWVGRRVLARYGVTDELVGLLSTCEPEPLIEVRDDGAVRSVGWLKRNPSKAALDARREAKREAGKRGNHVKHLHPGPYESCPICDPKHEVVAPCENDRSQPDSQSEDKASPETEGEGACEAPSSLGFAGPKPAAHFDAARSHLAPVPDPSPHSTEAHV